MADNTEILYASSDNLITVEGVQDVIAEEYILDAAVKLMICAEAEVLNIDADALATNKGGGKVGIPVTGHGLVSGAYIRVNGTENYNAEYTVEDSTEDEIVVTAAYEAETFTGEEKVYPSLSGIAGITLSYVDPSNGNYRGVLPYTSKLVAEREYYAIISIVSGDNQVLIVSRWKAHHKT